MSFWDNVSLELMIFCEKIRDTTLGKAILDGITDSLDSFDKNLERCEILLMDDISIEGKKRGYDRAALEYEAIFQEVEAEFLKTEQLLSSLTSTHATYADALIERLAQLEKEEQELEETLCNDISSAANKIGIPVSVLQSSICRGDTFRLLDFGINAKIRKFEEAERQGYQEAKAIYEAKIKQLKQRLYRLQVQGDKELSALITMINQILNAIADKQMRIAELQILCG